MALCKCATFSEESVLLREMTDQFVMLVHGKKKAAEAQPNQHEKYNMHVRLYCGDTCKT
jgi:hypothetical protein